MSLHKHLPIKRSHPRRAGAASPSLDDFAMGGLVRSSCAALALFLCLGSGADGFDPFKINPQQILNDAEDVFLGISKYLWATGVSKTCTKALQHTIKSFFKFEPWALSRK